VGPEITKTQEMVYEMKVGEVMTKNVITVGPKDPMSTLREILRHNSISGLPVLDGDQVVGLISLEDFIKWLADRQGDCAIQERMTGRIETVHDDDPLVLAISRFEKTGLGRFPVIRREDKALVGIVTKGDVIGGLLKKLEIDYHKEEVHRHRPSHIFEGIEADDTMLLFKYDVQGRDFKQAGISSSRLKRTLKRLGTRPDIVRRVAIACYEAEMNLVIFTEGGTIQAWVQPKAICVEVEDSGPGIDDIDKAMEPGHSTAPDWVRELGFGAGMGLVNIKKSSDRFVIRSKPGEGTLLRASFFTSEDKHETHRSGGHTRSGSEVSPWPSWQRGDRGVCQRSPQRCDGQQPRGQSVDHPTGSSECRGRSQHERSCRNYTRQRERAGRGYDPQGGRRRHTSDGKQVAGL